MTTPHHADTPETPDEQPHVTIPCRDNPAVGVRLCDARDAGRDAVHHAVEARAPGLAARLDEVVAWTWGGDGLAAFLERLAAEYRGWDGERSWETDDGDLAVSVFRSGGLVGLTWTLRPWRRAAGGWSASVTTWVEAGEQMAGLAADVRHFLASGANKSVAR
ncbi:DUF6228 family protein [Streptomyces tritici]|uniref:DUF6228 family protein n=1 Tax=Streptomyces tritici TaxID=2054410 RepID=UPI003AF1694F